MRASLPRRQTLLLVTLLVALAAALVYQFGSWGSTPPVAPRQARRATQAGKADLEAVPPLRLAELKAARPGPVSSGRDLFREKPLPPPPPPPRPVAQAPDPNAPPPGPPPPPPITLKFIGVLTAKEGMVAVFRDGGDVFYGREGELIEGRYRIIRIGVESVEMSYADGRGRQRIPLTG